jgi:hypothetical protein
MQVLNSPSREEVDDTHAKGSWLDIGVSSPRNAFRVSRFKLGCWVTLLLSSIPIHLLFNSAVFETDNRESDFHFTIASEEFISDGPYYPPGASLFLPGLVSIEVLNTFLINNTDLGPQAYTDTSPYNFGRSVYFSDYDDDNSPTVKNITDVARMARQWTRFEAPECNKMYFESCKGLKQYTDVVLVANHQGWIRDDMWKLGPDSSAFWDRYVPSNVQNNLFFDAQCSMTANIVSDGSVDCFTNCDAVVTKSSEDYYDGKYDNAGTDANNGSRWNFVFGDTYTGSTYLSSEIEHPIDGLPSDWDVKTSLKRQAFSLTVDHCLARPIQSQCRKSCQIWMALTWLIVYSTQRSDYRLFCCLRLRSAFS